MSFLKASNRKIIFLYNQENLDTQLCLVTAECIITEFAKFNYQCYCLYTNPFFTLCEDIDNVFCIDRAFEENFIFEEIEKNYITKAFIITFDKKTLKIANKIKKKFGVKILNETLSEKDINLIEDKYSYNKSLKKQKTTKDKLMNFFEENPLSKIDLEVTKKNELLQDCISKANIHYILSGESKEIFYKENIDYSVSYRVSFFVDKNKNYFIYSTGEYLLKEEEEVLLFPAASMSDDISLKIEETVKDLTQSSLLKAGLYSLDFNISNDCKVFFKINNNDLSIKNFISNVFDFGDFISFLVNFFIENSYQYIWQESIKKTNIFEKELSKIIYLNKNTQEYRYFANKSIKLNFFELRIFIKDTLFKKLKLNEYLRGIVNKKTDIQEIKILSSINNSFYLSDKLESERSINLLILIEENFSHEKRFFYKQIYKKIKEENSLLSTTLMEELIYASYLKKKHINISNSTLVKIIDVIKDLKYYFLFGDLYLNLDIINQLREKKIQNILQNDSIKFLKHHNINIGLSCFMQDEVMLSNYVVDLKVIVIKKDNIITKIFINSLKESYLYIVDDNLLNFWTKDLEEKKTKEILDQIQDFKFLIIHYTCTDVDIKVASVSFDLSFEIIFYSNLINKNLLSFILGNVDNFEIKEKFKHILTLKKKNSNFLVLQDTTIGRIYFKMIKLHFPDVIKNKIILIKIDKVFYTKYFTICHYLIKEGFIIFSNDDNFIYEANILNIQVLKYKKSINYSVYINQNHNNITEPAECNLENAMELNHFLEVEFFIQGVKFFRKLWTNKKNIEVKLS